MNQFRIGSLLEDKKLDKGYDYLFLDTVPERFICSICSLPMRDPHLVVCCGQKYCHSCLQKWLKNKPSCPYCRFHTIEVLESGQFGQGFKLQHVPERGLAREIDSLHIKCSNYDKGCQWTGEVRDLSHHLCDNSFGSSRDSSSASCEFAEITCGHCMQWKGERSYHQAHLTSEDGCPNYSVQCPVSLLVPRRKYSHESQESL